MDASEYEDRLADYADACAALQAEINTLRKDAERYLWLRGQHWSDNTIAAVRWPKDAIKLGHDAPSGDRLDALIDEAMQAHSPASAAE